MQAEIAVAKIGKYATSESGDTVEMIERPMGGFSFVLSDGQRSGRSAKVISNVVARKAISLLSEGVRDGAAARAASDYLYTYRAGKVLATLNILSIDMQTQTMVITRNNPSPVILIHGSQVHLLDNPTSPVGSRSGIRPEIHEVPLEVGLAAVVYTDGFVHAGSRIGVSLDMQAEVEGLAVRGVADSQAWADHLLSRAVDLDQGRPGDDMSVVVARVLQPGEDRIRRLFVRVPI